MRRHLIVALAVILTLLPTSQAKALTIDLETLLKGVSQVLTDVGGSPGAEGLRAADPAGTQQQIRPPAIEPETHPTPAVEQEGSLPPPPAPALPSPRPQTAPEPQPSPSPILRCIRRIESGGDYEAVSESGKYRGAYQFSRSTWNSVGGSGDPAAASVGEQDKRAEILLDQRGLQPWPTPNRECQ